MSDALVNHIARKLWLRCDEARTIFEIIFPILPPIVQERVARWNAGFEEDDRAASEALQRLRERGQGNER